MEKEGKRGKKREKVKDGVEYLIIVRIDKKLKEVGMSRPKLVAALRNEKRAFAKNTLANWSARKTIPSADIALAIADALQCSVRWLITGDDKEEVYSFKEKNLITKFRDMDEQGRRYIEALLNVDSETGEKKADVVAAVEKKLAAG
jgi:transcriptional regulator with XRE-family HTH domain